MYKLKRALKKNKYMFIIFLLLWIALSIVFVTPVTISKVDATINGEFDIDCFFNQLFVNFGNIKGNIGKAFSSNYFRTFLKGEIFSFLVLTFVAVVGLIKAFPKHEFTDIEHGSSDWAANGEQYQILSPKKGIILAEKNFLPVDKRGNVNVLVVGRFWFW